MFRAVRFDVNLKNFIKFFGTKQWPAHGAKEQGKVSNHQIRNMALQFTAFTQNHGAQLFRLYSTVEYYSTRRRTRRATKGVRSAQLGVNRSSSR